MKVDIKHVARLDSSYICHHLLDRSGINAPGQLGAAALAESTDSYTNRQAPIHRHNHTQTQACEYQCGLTLSKQESGKC